MIRKIRLANFKAHLETRIAFRNLTVLTGTNSSGKSSVIQALLLLRQSYLKGSLRQGLDLNESLCALGVGKDVLSRYAKDELISIGIEDALAHEFAFDAGNFSESSFLKKYRYSESVSTENLEKISLFNKGFQYVSSSRLGAIGHFDPVDYEVNELRQVSKVGGRGEAVAQFLCQYGRERVQIYATGGDSSLMDEVVRWEQMISPNLTINAQKDGRGTGFDILYGYAYEDEKPISDLSAGNVGFGISHSLPIVTSLLAARPGDLILIENPEAHLHPKGQAILAELICRAARAGVQIVLETHSDHIVNGVLLATKHFEDDANDVRGLGKGDLAIYHMSTRSEKPHVAVVEEIVVENQGLINYQPPDFFDQYENDLNELSGAWSND